MPWARASAGAEIHRFTPVTATRPQPDGTGSCETPKGDIHTEWVINAAGLWGREVGRWPGIEPAAAAHRTPVFRHRDHAEIAAMDRRLPSVADRDGEYYLRQEGKGLLIGAYERTCGSGPRTARRSISGMTSSPTISSGSRRT
jgi:dimethylglycine dehydrogenase